MKALVVGFGSAGRRHKKYLEMLGLRVDTVDPNVSEATFQSLEEAINRPTVYDLAVVATPPDLHPEHTVMLLSKTRVPKILCEKPLCGWDQMDAFPEDDRVRIAYNYRYHPWIAKTLGPEPSQGWFLFSIQKRERIPEWGLLLDHVSHDFDILSWKAGLAEITNATWITYGPIVGWWITGHTERNAPVYVLDLVSTAPGFRRYVTIWRFDRAALWIKMSSEMFRDMIRAAVSGHAWASRLPTVSEARHVQALLEQARSLGKSAPPREVS